MNRNPASCVRSTSPRGGAGVQGEYQRAINRMGRATLGALHRIFAAESGPAPARALLDHRQSRLTQRLYTGPRDGDGPGEVLAREGRLRDASQGDGWGGPSAFRSEAPSDASRDESLWRRRREPSKLQTSGDAGT